MVQEIFHGHKVHMTGFGPALWRVLYREGIESSRNR